jgi:phosphoribosylformimino-5-aminoimidazole carboxamide ribotide isomerase
MSFHGSGAHSASGRRAFAVIPAVDIAGEAVVRLERGRFERVTVRAGDPRAVVRRWADFRPPLIHVVDLDGARHGRTRPQLIADLATVSAPTGLQVAGGIRSVVDAYALLNAGATRVVVGTAAFARTNALTAFVKALGQKLVVAIDVLDGIVRVRGWYKSSGLSVDDAVRLCRDAGVIRIMCTAIDRDGTMTGPDVTLQQRVVEAAYGPVLAAGGIRSTADLGRLESLGLEGAVVGRALFESHGLDLCSVWPDR